MLYCKGRVLRRNYEVIGGEVEVIAVEIALQNAFESFFADGNLDPIGLSLALKSGDQAGKETLSTEEPLWVVDGGSDDRNSHAVSHWLTDFCGADATRLSFHLFS